MSHSPEYVILVDANDQVIGTEEKLKAHQLGLLHRAFSVFLFRNQDRQEVLLQQRAAGKYHCPGLWSNTCCSHPRQGETVLAAAERRLQEELGVVAPLRSVGHFQYKAYFSNGLIEHEFDHVLIGEFDGPLSSSNPQEVAATRWVTVATLQEELKTQPESFTPWLAKALNIAMQS